LLYAPSLRRQYLHVSCAIASLRERCLLLGASALVVSTSLIAPLSLPRSASSHPRAPSLVLRVVGNHLVDGTGSVVRLLGVDRSGAEYECMYSSQVFDGPTNAASVAAIAAWHTNSVRVPLNEDCWLGINGAYRGASGLAYRQAIEGYVSLLEAHGLYVILDLHWAAPGRHRALGQWPMADATHAPAFWRSVAQAFRSNQGVLFDLYNEPYLSSWRCWKVGCETSYDDDGAKVRYRTAGMQQLVDAVRSTGATTPLMLGGLSWASDETGWLAHAPVDPLHQLVVSFHTYDFSGCDTAACWNSTIAPLTTQVPVVTGEFGEAGCKDTYDLAYMPWADAHGVSYLGWTWDSTGPPSHWSCSGGPSLITSYAGSPTSYGIGLRRHLAALARA
jgi:endoglucanase